MGKNADKRKARKGGFQGEGPAVGVASPETDARAQLDTGEPRSLAGDAAHLLDDGLDGSLSRALFKLTCLLAVRGRDGIPRENLRRVATEVASIIEADTISLLRLEAADDGVPARLVLLCAHGLAGADEGLVTFELGDGVAGQVASAGEAVRIEDAPRDPRFHRLYGQRTEIGSLLAVPLRYPSTGKNGRIVGVLTASRREIRAFQDDDEERLLLVGNSIAQDLEQTRVWFDAVTDALTGLGSRLSLLVELPRALEVARRYRTELSLLILDVDGLRAVNERHGKLAGDRFLVETGRRLRSSLRAADSCARLGGDEIAVLLPMTSANAARALAKRLVRLLSQPMPGLDGTVPTWSVGTATLAPGDEDALGLLWRCDEAVSSAKTQGGDSIVSAVLRRQVIE
jgi:diguanylate cyclase (GGDEF)-like protein